MFLLYKNTSINKCTRSLSRVQTNKQVENCFLNHNSSIHFCCTDSLLMTHYDGLSLSIIIWRIGGGDKFPFALGPNNFLGGPDCCVHQVQNARMFPITNFQFMSIETVLLGLYSNRLYFYFLFTTRI